MREQSKQDKAYRRMAMSKVRADVRNFVEKGETNGLPHLGDYPKTMEDAVRTIIALQDMLEDSTNRHDKATKHIIEQKETIDIVSTLLNMVATDATMKSMDVSEQIGFLTKQRDGMTDECTRLSEGWREANMEIFSLKRLNKSLKVTLQDSMKDLPLE